MKYWSSLLLLMLSALGFSQEFSNDKERLEYANELFEQKKYIEAFPHFLNALGNNRQDTDLNFKFGACQLFANEDKTECLPYLRFASKKSGVDPRVFFFLGKAYHLNYKFRQAETFYKKFADKADSKMLKKMSVENHIRMVQNGRALLRNLTELIVEEKKESSYEKFYYSYDLSNIGGRILVYEEKATKLDKKKDYKSLIYFPSRDVDILFYSSYGKDGETGLDLYKVERNASGDWGDPVRLPDDINTPYDDAYAFLHADGESFYFCSKGHSSMGGYDVFRSTFNRLTGSFSKPVNMDYKINTPDDDILYVVDSMNLNAYFSSARAAQGGFLDVYKVKVKSFPVQNVILAGNFVNEIDPADNYATIKVENALTGQQIGTFHPDENGAYVLVLPKNGKYKLFVETPNSEKIHAAIIDIPPEKVMEPLKQEVALVKEGGEEFLRVRNLFDQAVSNSEDLIAGVLKQLADQEVNADQFDAADVVDGFSGSNEDLIKRVEDLAVEAENKVDEIDRRTNAAYALADKESTRAIDLGKQANEAIEELKGISDPEERRNKIKEIKDLHEESEDAQLRAITAANLADQLEKEKVSQQEQATKSRSTADAVKAALEGGDAEAGMAQLKALEDDLAAGEADQVDEYDRINALSKEKQGEADAKMAEAQAVRNQMAENSQKVRALNNDIQEAKDNGESYAHLEQQVNDLKAQEPLLEQKSKDLYDEYENLQSKADDLSAQAHMLNEVSDGSDEVASDEQKTRVKSMVDSEELFAEIKENDSFVAQLEAEEAGTEPEIETTDYSSFEDELAAIADESDPVVKAQLEKDIHERMIAQLDTDIKKYRDLASVETDPEMKQRYSELAAELLAKKDEKEFKLNENTQVLADAGVGTSSDGGQGSDSGDGGDLATDGGDIGTDSGDGSSDEGDGSSDQGSGSGGSGSDQGDSEPINYDVAYSELESQEESIENIIDPVEKATEENKINEKYIDLKTAEAKEIKNRMNAETDPEKKTEQLLALNNLFAEIDEKEKAIDANNEKIRAGGGTVEPDTYDPDEAFKGSAAYDEFTESIESDIPSDESFSVDIEEDYSFVNQDATDQIAGIGETGTKISMAEVELQELNDSWIAETKQGKKDKIQTDIDEKEAELNGHYNEVIPKIEGASEAEQSANQSRIDELKSAAATDPIIKQDKNFARAEYLEAEAQSDFASADRILEMAKSEEDPTKKSEYIETANQKIRAGSDKQKRAIEALEAMDEDGYVASHFEDGGPLRGGDSGQGSDSGDGGGLATDSGDSGSDQGDGSTDGGGGSTDQADQGSDSGDGGDLATESGDSGSDQGDGSTDGGDSGADQGDQGSDSGDGGDLATDGGDSGSDQGDGSTDGGDGSTDQGDQGSDSGDGGDLATDGGDSGSDQGDGSTDVGDSGADQGDQGSDSGDGGDLATDSGDSGSDQGDGSTDGGDGSADQGDQGSDSGDGGDLATDSGDSGSDQGDGSTDVGDGSTDEGDQGSDSGDGGDLATDGGDSGADQGDGSTDVGDGSTDQGDQGSDSGDFATDSGDSGSDQGTSENRTNDQGIPTEIADEFSAPTESGVSEETVGGVTFNPDNDPEVYGVSTTVETKQVGDIEYENGGASLILDEHREDVDLVTSLNSDIETLEGEKEIADPKNQKLLSKGIKKLEKKRLKTEKKLIEPVQEANEKEIATAQVVVEETIKFIDGQSVDGYQMDQGIAYRDAGDALISEAEGLRADAENVKDKEEKMEMIRQAQTKEVEAAAMYRKAKKMITAAVVENYGFEKEDLTGKVPQDESQRESEKILAQARNANNAFIEYTDMAALTRDSLNSAKKKDQKELLARAEKYEKIAAMYEQTAQELNVQYKKVKSVEDAIVQDEYLVDNLDDQKVGQAKATKEYADFIKEQDEIDRLNRIIKVEKKGQDGYESLAIQQESKAKDLRAKAQDLDSEEDKQDLITLAETLEESAKANRKAKSVSMARVEDIYTKKEEVEAAQEMAIANVSEETKDIYRGIVLSGEDRTPGIYVPPVDAGDLLAAGFRPPERLNGSLYKKDDSFAYSEDNPIPVNVQDPKGLVYKVQIGAFRRRIPASNFKGFAPMSAEELSNGITRYRVGYFDKYNAANSAKGEIRTSGYPDAFVVAFYDGEKITLQEALNIENNGGRRPGDEAVDTAPVVDTTPVNGGGDSVGTGDTGTDSDDNGDSGTDASDQEGGTNINDLADGEALELETLQGVFYTVQVGVYSKKIQSGDVLSISPLVVKKVGDYYKYTTGIFRELGEAVTRKNDVIEKGVTDAFVVAFHDGKRVTLQRAKELINALGEEVLTVNPEGDVNVKSPTPVNGLVYRIYLGTYSDGVPEYRARVFMNLKDDGVPIEEAFLEEDGSESYFCGKHGLFKDAETMLIDFKSEGVSIAEIVAYKDGEKIDLEEAKKMTKED